MSVGYMNTEGKGHPIKVLDLSSPDVSSASDTIAALLDSTLTAVVVRGVLEGAELSAAVSRLKADQNAALWGSPNQGMPGGEIRTIGDAATPTFTAFRGPPAERYAASAGRYSEYTAAIFGSNDPLERLQSAFSGLFAGRPARPPVFDADTHWLPFNYRALDPGVQIYSHHDNHYGLGIYEHLDERYDREALLSWFVTLQPADAGGQLIVYGLWGSDPEPPMLPTRFLDTEVLERDYLRYTFDLEAGDLIIFNSGRHVHRVSPVEGTEARMTLGGFLTTDRERTHLVHWS